jgi:hypothetical protein
MRSLWSATPRTCSARLNLDCRRNVCLLLVLVLITATAPRVVELDAASTWARTYRGSEDSIGKGVVHMQGGDIIVAGTLGATSIVVTRLSPEGDVRWSNTYETGGATLGQDIVSVIACTPGGMLVFGRGDSSG